MFNSTTKKLFGTYLALVLLSWAGLAAVAASGRVFAPHDVPEGPMVLAFAIAIGLLFAFLAVGIGIFVFRDARRRGMEPWTWALVAVFVPYFMGLVIYLLARKTVPLLCEGCGQAVAEGDVFCPHCGERRGIRCPDCDRELASAGRFCPGCGSEQAISS